VSVETQVNDFNPGTAPSKLFWTVAVPPSSVEIAGASGRARFHLENYAIPDYHDILNSLGLTPNPIAPVPSHVTFDVQWNGGGDRLNVRDQTFGFAGEFVGSEATISFSVMNDGGPTYTSVTADQKIVSSAVGHERNGVYFK
jgi:hypothetical protein